MDIHQLSKALSPKIRGWVYYYGKFHISGLKTAFLHLNRRLAKFREMVNNDTPDKVIRYFIIAMRNSVP